MIPVEGDGKDTKGGKGFTQVPSAGSPKKKQKAVPVALSPTKKCSTGSPQKRSASL
eukprot:CAMPEP_0202459884 /NCGR_PEP_ID=MMETSP1360-20130828/39647_1 /ASSEMBLY_ACC=CAM_ASM_000848 /TAXON_ID=515479 /ORGANISM="Licmophora paradoxa, Strain CCMP2313" /LENGTH=55 /DNA_ID=CAMNT_0049081237 /DNA_START=77 /DNA_END=241 /DNA_ORIENTATION=-